MYVYIDFEFNNTREKKLNVVCAAWEIWQEGERVSKHSEWLEGVPQSEFVEEMQALSDQGAIFVVYQAIAEAGSFYSLGIHPFKNIKWIDLYLEYRMLLNHNHKYAYGWQLINGKKRFTLPPKPKWERTKADDGKSAPPNYGLAAACYKMLNEPVDTDHKNKMRDLIIAGGPYGEGDRKDILSYCESDVKFLPRLHLAISKAIKSGGLLQNDIITYEKDALLRGDFAARSAIMERLGHPFDYQGAKNFSSHVATILFETAKEITEAYPQVKPFIFNAKKGVFHRKEKNIRAWIAENHTTDDSGVDWDKTETGKASLSLEAFEKHYPSSDQNLVKSFGSEMVRFLKTQKAMNGFLPNRGGKKSFWDYVGSDQRVRPYMGIYGAQSARSQPAATGFIPLKAKWMRALIQPPAGYCYISCDWSSQEFLLGGLLSGDTRMIAAYQSGDPYLYTAILSGAAPKNATKKTHEPIRDKFKSTVLGISYLMGPVGLGKKLTEDTGVPHTEEDAQKLINIFQNTYSVYNKWRHQVYKDYKKIGYLRLPCGWLMFGDNPNRRSVSNCPVQGAGSSAMRESVRRAQDRRLQVAFTLHDELCILSPVKDLVKNADALADSMDEGFKHYFPRYSDKEKSCRLSAKIWGPDFKDGQTIDTRWFTNQKLYSQAVNENSSPDYAKYKRYFSHRDPALDLKEILDG